MVVVAIVALKTDLLHSHGVDSNEVVQEYEVEQLAQALNVMYVPTSSKLDVNVTNLFSRVAEEVLLRRKRGALGMGGQNGVQWNGGGQFTNGGGGRKMPQSRASSSNTEARPSSPMSSKELYGKYYENDNATKPSDSKHDHRDDSNTSSSMMLPNNDMMNGNNNDVASGNNNDNDTATITSSSNADVRSTPVAMSEAAAAVGDGKEGQNECDITMEIDLNKDDVLDGEEEDGENNGSFFMMCGVCGNTSDIIE